MRLRYTVEARSHIKAIYDYLAERNPTAALEIVSRIHGAAQLLQDFPRIGRAGIDPGTAEWVVRGSPYVIVYEVDMNHDELVILAAFHGSRSRTQTRTKGRGEMTAHMFAAIRRGKLKPGMADEFAKRVKAGAVPVLTKLPGFKAYYLVFGGEDTVMAVSLFTSRTAEDSNARLMPWIKENLGPLFASPTEATEGEVVISVVA